MKCDYGCGQEAIHQFKNGKWCCSKYYRSCPEIRKLLKGENNPFYNKYHTQETKKIMSSKKVGVKHSEKSKERISESMKGNKNPNFRKTWKQPIEVKIKISNSCKGKIPWNKDKKGYYTDEQIKNISEKNKGQKAWNKGIPHTIDSRKKMSISSRMTIEYIKKKYPLFSKIEEMRYNPNKPEEHEIQVHCKNHNCPNSKEQGGWFTPTYQQIQCRKNNLEKDDGNEGSYFYCSDQCKNICPLFNLQLTPLKKLNKCHTTTEYQIFRQTVLERDNNVCQYCGDLAEHVHHEIPQKINQYLALDPDTAISVCKDCHYRYGHRDECSMINISKNTGVL